MPMRRRSESGFYHVMLRGNAKQIIFEDDDDRRRFLALLGSSTQGTSISIVAWCFMDNHVHLVLADPKDEVSAALHDLAMSYALYFNRKCQRTGHVFEGRYKSLPIDTDEYLLQVVRYVINNPVAAGISSLDDYPWSSFPEYCGQKGLTDVGIVLDMFESPEDFEQFCREGSQPYDRKLEHDSVPDAMALPVANHIAMQLGYRDVSQVTSLSREKQSAFLSDLADAGLTHKQIARLTGISASTISRRIREAEASRSL